jgi:hypothetical protein
MAGKKEIKDSSEKEEKTENKEVRTQKGEW